MDRDTPEKNQVILRRVFGLLERLEAHHGSGVLTLTNQEESRGKFIIDRNSVCFVKGLSEPKLGELFKKNYPESAVQLRKTIHQANQDGIKLSQALKKLGEPVVTQVREILMRQSALAAIELAETHVEDEFDASMKNARASWDGRFLPVNQGCESELSLSFSPLSIYLEAANILDTSLSDEASELWHEFYELCTFSALFLAHETIEGSTILPVAFKSEKIDSLADLRKLTFAIHQIVLPPSLGAAGIKPTSMMFGAKFNDLVVLIGTSRVVVLSGSTVGDRARIAGRTVEKFSIEPQRDKEFSRGS